jgi:hypothetical protein
MFDVFEIDILYDVSAGCQRRCDDCVISSASPMENLKTSKFSDLLNQASKYFLLGNCWLGPTDIFASNQSISYTDKEVVDIAGKFKSVILSTSLLGRDEDIILHAKNVAEHYKDISIKLAIPVNLKLVDNVKYRNHIWNKINLFEKSLGRPLGTPTRKVYFIGNLPIEDDIIDPDIFLKFKKDWGVQLDIAIGNGRRGIEHLRPVFDRSKDFFLNRINKENNFPAALLKEGRGIDLLFRNGDIYFLPFYNERIAVLDEQFKLLKYKSWTIDNLISDINSLMITSLKESEKLTECKNCIFNSRCSLFLLPIIQSRLNIDTCIQPIELLKLNGTDNKTNRSMQF